MDRDEARAQVQDVLGHRSDLVTYIERGFRFAQKELESEATLPWFLRKVDTGQNTSIGSNVLPRPADYIRLWPENPITLTTSDASIINLVQGPLWKLQDRFDADGAPGGFYEIGEQFIVYPVPQLVYPITFTYYAKDATLDTNIENKWLKYLPGLMVGRAGFIVAAGIRDQAAMQVFGAMAAAGTEKINQMSTAQDEDSGKPVIGGED